MENKLSNQISFMERNNIKFSYTAYTAFNDTNGKEKFIHPPKKFDFEKFIKNTSIATSTMIVEREVAKNIKFSDTKICEDYFFKCSLLKKVGFAYSLDILLTKYRIRKSSLQSNKIKNLIWLWKINKKMNKFTFFKNFFSLIMISINSIKKYGYK